MPYFRMVLFMVRMKRRAGFSGAPSARENVKGSMLHTLADVIWLELTETPPQFILKLSQGSRDLSEGK